jgi:hypothetical protein
LRRPRGQHSVVQRDRSHRNHMLAAGCFRSISSKYPPAEPGALVLEPLKAACPCRSSQCPGAEPPQLGKLRYLLSTWCALISFIIHLRSALFGARRLTIQSFIDGPVGFDFLKCQTFAASPAEPGELLFWFRFRGPAFSTGCQSGNRGRLEQQAARMAPRKYGNRRW